MLIHNIVWIVFVAALVIGSYFGFQTFRVWHALVDAGKITGWRLPMAKVFAHPELSRPYMRASAAGVVAAIALIFLHTSNPF